MLCWSTIHHHEIAFHGARFCITTVPRGSISWWRHQMEKFSALLVICAGNSPVTDEFPTQRPVKWSVAVFFDLHLNKRLSKQSWGWWFETILRPLWRHCNISRVLRAISVLMPTCYVHNIGNKCSTIQKHDLRLMISCVMCIAIQYTNEWQVKSHSFEVIWRYSDVFDTQTGRHSYRRNCGANLSARTNLHNISSE